MLSVSVLLAVPRLHYLMSRCGFIVLQTDCFKFKVDSDLCSAISNNYENGR